MRHLYGVGLVLLGAWEAAAFATSGRVLTVSATVRGSPRRQAALLLWMAGAALHVLRR